MNRPQMWTTVPTWGAVDRPIADPGRGEGNDDRATGSLEVTHFGRFSSYFLIR